MHEALRSERRMPIARLMLGVVALSALIAAQEQIKELVILDGSAHAQFVLETDQGDRLLGEIRRFLTAP